MSILDVARRHRPSPIVAAAAVMAGRARAVLCALRDWQVAHSAARHLRSLSDAQLKDIGIARGQIEFLVRRNSVSGSGGGHAKH